MKLARLTLTRFSALGILFVMVLMAAMFIASSSAVEPVAHDVDCSDDCCDDKADTCTDCFRCVSSIHMIAIDVPDLPAGIYATQWDLPALVLESERNLARAIDHPPQNLL